MEGDEASRGQPMADLAPRGAQGEELVMGDDPVLAVGEFGDPAIQARVDGTLDGSSTHGVCRPSSGRVRPDALGQARPAMAASGVAPSCTTAISARVMPVGSGCWMTLRP